MLHCVFLKPWE